MSSNSKEESRSNELNLYPEKPLTEMGFKKAVAWFGGRELVASLKDSLMYAVFGENIDPRSWMNPNIYPNNRENFLKQKQAEKEERLVETNNPETAGSKMLYSTIQTQAKQEIRKDETVISESSANINKEWAKKIFDHWEWKRNYYQVWDDFSKDKTFWNKLQPHNQELKEFWFDYIADTGDGQLGVYNVACMCLSDLWLDDDEDDDENRKYKQVRFRPPKATGLNDKVLLPRGAFLFIGGDTAYHTSNYATLVERVQHPFRWAFTSVREFTEEIYLLKNDKKIEARQALKKRLDSLKKKDSNFREELAGALPGENNSIEFSDTEPTRPIFGIPANHDYYDGIDGFNRQFRRAPFGDIEENQIFDGKRGKFLLQIPTFSRKQEASYIAVSLPFDWWFFGIDSENEKLDFRQELYFTDIVEQHKTKKLILATPEPTTVFGKKSDPDDKTASYLKAVTANLGLSQPFLTDGKMIPLKKKSATDSQSANQTTGEQYCRLDLSGDVHHYARYWGEDSRNFGETTDKFHAENYASVVAGGGGAFFDVTKTLIGKPLNKRKNPIFKDRKVEGEIPPQNVFPSPEVSVNKTADKLFDTWNIRNGGYVHFAGLAMAAILFYFLTYFSNFSEVLKKYDSIILTDGGSIFGNHFFVSILLFLGVGVFIFATVLMVNRLIEKLKTKSFKNELDEKKDARILQLAVCYIPFVIAIPFYFITLSNIFDNRNPLPKTALDNFLISCNLIVVFLIFFLLLWLSSEHTNWLAVRFKIVRKYKRKTITQTIEDPNEKTDSRFLKLIGKLSRLYSYQYFLSNVLVLAAFAFLITGISIFGTVSISKTLADTVLVLIFAGFFILLVIVLGVLTGAGYHRSFRYKFYFFVLGLWHYILQIATPLVLFFYGSWSYLFLHFVIIGLLNGSGLISSLIRYFFVKENKNSDWEAIANFRIAAVMTKYFDKFVLFAVWLIYGSAILLYPLLSPPQVTIRQSIQNFFAKYSTSLPFYEGLRQTLSNFYNISFEKFDYQFEIYCTIWVSILVIGYIGYLMSRVWLGWYLAVSMLFDGHNNEAGGAARIEGFKHILRIKVEETQLTVYVIGFDEAQADMKNLEMKLVDKFTLKCKPVT